jgi:hypothetical protein
VDNVKIDVKKRLDGMVWTGSIWLRIGTSEGLLWRRWWTSGFTRMLGKFLSGCIIGSFWRKAQH